MLLLWRPLCLCSITTRCQISRVAHFKSGLLFSWVPRETFKLHVRVQRRHSSALVKGVRHGGLRSYSGILIKTGDTFELDDGTFVRVEKVVHNEFYNRYCIFGWKFVRNIETFGLPHHPNEVYWVVHLAKTIPQPAEAAQQVLIVVDDSQILRKRKLTMTNKEFHHQNGTGADLGVPGDAELFCRWKQVIITKIGKCDRPLDAFHIPAAEIAEASLQRLRAEECDLGHNNRTADEKLRRSWWSLTKRQDASIESREDASLPLAIEALSLDDGSSSRKECGPPAYTYADVCCGAGGASQGAQLAGLQLRWALDDNASACETFRLNFPKMRLYLKPIKDIIHLGPRVLIVDMLHLSPPCQAFSAANTTPNLAKNAVNIAANMDIGKCLDAARPRIVTLEQTSNLMSEGRVGGRHSEHWNKVLQQFTSRGYSVAWKIMNFAELGLPQARKRLIMIASW